MKRLRVEAEQPPDVQRVIKLVRESYPDVKWTRLTVTHPGDNDRLWFFWLSDEPGDVQIEFYSSSEGCPFLVETDKHDERFIGNTVEEVAQTIVDWLSMPGGTLDPYWFRREWGQ